MAMPPVFVAIAFFAAVAAALALMAFIAWRGSKPSEFFLEAVQETYELQLPEAEIDAYYDLKDRLEAQYGNESGGTPVGSPGAGDMNGCGRQVQQSWTQRVPPELRQELQKALMRRLVGGIEKLDQVQTDKPGSWKLWRRKLLSERYWASLCDAERLVGEEIDCCVAEADELEPGWRESVFPQAVRCWRMQKHQDAEKKASKKAVEQVKKQKEKDVRRVEVEARQKEDDRLRQEKLAEKAMEKLLREEEKAAKAKPKAAAAKPKAKKK